MSPSDATRLCVVHGCERRGDQERVIRLGGKDVVAGFCGQHAPGQRESTARRVGDDEATAG